MTNAIVVGSGPNGLAAAITLAQRGIDVTLIEAADTVGGGLATSENTLPGLLHDDCAAVVPTAVMSPFIRTLDLESYGLQWAWPEVDLAHPLDGGRAGVMVRSLSETEALLGVDGHRWRRLFEPLAQGFDELATDILRPLVHLPRHPMRLARFGPLAMIPASALVRTFRTEEARALFAGNAAHAWQPLHLPPTSGVALMFSAAGHRYGWPVVKGGSARLADALVRLLSGLGAKIETGHTVRSLTELPAADIVMFDLAPSAIVDIVGDRLPIRVQRAYRRFRYGSAAFKADFAVEDGVPWTNEHCQAAGTVHVCGSFPEIVEAERATHSRRMPERPFIIVAQQYLADPSRSVGNIHPVYAYAHVPQGFSGDATEAILGQIERFAPGFRERIVATYTRSPTEIGAHNANNVGGDINGGAMDFRQFIARPRIALNPYRTGVPGVYICSSSTPPGGGVHGMCGHNAALAAIGDIA
ncbi:NAD(P)/FAD-dependent oxidoreductase [Mycobacterium sp. shizuoka-1]|uniref:phytoene desaturase family protein n=1 Tax=Mycobacterium sp. shizuoka-1 TaxID=2039281 RepID=UPI000C0645C2|nr:NAD(P)/FAD-dependent oxidoreductase [Mycobacterium sp. shizuoka-1]GAY15821.1 putative dehydrogenase [Mycobacterium sp. shizuoka-1]